jgi:antitoxin component YwqK of YwqJK toxin-antitoxin module
MKKIINILFFVIITYSHLQSQTSFSNFVDSFGKKQGIWKVTSDSEIDTDENVYAIGSFIDNFKVGVWNYYYYYNGNARNSIFYNYDTLVESFDYFLPNGKLISIGLINNGLGVIKNYYGNGKCRNECFYVNGKKNGLCLSYDLNGKKIGESMYIENERCYLKSYINGRLRIEKLIYKDVGHVKFYDHKGLIESEEYGAKSNNLTTEIFYNKKGKIEYIRIYNRLTKTFENKKIVEKK